MKQLYFSFVCIAFLALGAFRLHLAKKNDCEMTYMHPGYEHISVPGNDSPYSLVRYTGDRKRRDDKVLSTFCHHFASFRPEPIGSFVARLFFLFQISTQLRTTAVVFVPGHKGDVYQVRSLGSHVRRLDLPLEVYGLDVLAEPSALHAGLLWQQARFAALAVRHVASRHTSAPNVLMVR